MSRAIIALLAFALAACAPSPPDRRIGGPEPDWGRVAREVGRTIAR